MSIASTPAPLAGSIVFPFENLYILRQNGPVRVFGHATFSFDGDGATTLIGLVVDSAVFGGPARLLRYGEPDWREIGRRLDQYHHDDIQARIAEELERKGGHMALFSTMAPAHVIPSAVPERKRPRHRPAWPMRPAVTTAAEAMSLGLLMAGIMGVCLVADETRSHHQAHSHVATLEVGAGR